jgi:hypothetical protein
VRLVNIAFITGPGGDQLDLRPVTCDEANQHTLTDGQVAGYLAKYATKGAEASGKIDHPIAADRVAGLDETSKTARAAPCVRARGLHTLTSPLSLVMHKR